MTLLQVIHEPLVKKALKSVAAFVKVMRASLKASA